MAGSRHLVIFPFDCQEVSKWLRFFPKPMLEYLQVPIWSKYQTICDQAEGSRVNIYKQERFEFYERAKQAYAIVATGETALYGNVILKKGVIPGDD